MREADAEREPAAERKVGGQRLLRKNCRVPRVGRDHGGAELDTWYLTACHGQRDECLEAEDI